MKEIAGMRAVYVEGLHVGAVEHDHEGWWGAADGKQFGPFGSEKAAVEAMLVDALEEMAEAEAPPLWHVLIKTWEGKENREQPRPKSEAEELARNAISRSWVKATVVNECTGEGCRECLVLNGGTWG